MRRNPLQSILIVLVIAMPVAAGAFGLTAYQSTRPTPIEQVTNELGQAQAMVRANVAPSKYDYQEPSNSYAFEFQSDGGMTMEGDTGGDPIALADPRKTIAGYEWLPETQATADVETATGIGTLQVIEGEPWSPLLEGRYFGLTGRAPANETELLVNRAALVRLGAKVGDQVKLTEAKKSLTIVGTLESASAARNVSVLYGMPAAITGQPVSIETASFFAIGEKPITWQQITKINKQGIGVLSREVLLNPPANSEVPLYVETSWGTPSNFSLMLLIPLLFLAPLVLLPVAVLAGSAFSFGARRQARSLAVVSSLGAKASLLRFMTIANGIVLGLAGGVVGVIAGVIVANFWLPSLTDGSRTGYPGLHLRFDLLALAAVSGAIIGAIVSVIPAFVASKVDVLNTLRGVRRNAKVQARSGVGGLIVIAVGVAVAIAGTLARTYIEGEIRAGRLGYEHYSDIGWTLFGIGIGAIITVIGLLVASPWLLVMARFLFRRISTASNYATNDLIYNRKRYTAVIASVLATAFVGASVLALMFSIAEAQRVSYRPQGETDQLVIDHSGYAIISGSVPVANTNAELKRVIAQNTSKLASNLSAAKEIAETKSAALINVHEQYAQFGFGLASEGPIIGFEGQQPYLMRDANYFCPYAEGSPVYDKFMQLQQDQQWDAAAKIENDPKYARCQITMMEPSRFMVGTPADLRALLGGRVDSAAEKSLTNGGAVVFHPGLMKNGKAILNWYASGLDALVLGQPMYDNMGKPMVGKDGKPLTLDNPTKTESVPAVLSSTPSTSVTMMLSTEAADKLGITYSPWIMVANYKEPVTTAQRDQMNQAFNGEFTLEQGFGFDTQAAAWWVTLAVGFFILASTSIALGLAQIESRADQSTLGSIGAPKRFRASVVGGQALVLTLLGTVLGSSVGFLFAWAMFPSMKLTIVPVDLVIPPAQAAVMVIGIPLIAASIFWFGTPSRSRFRTRLSID
jgi:hypothetical protein